MFSYCSWRNLFYQHQIFFDVNLIPSFCVAVYFILPVQQSISNNYEVYSILSNQSIHFCWHKLFTSGDVLDLAWSPLDKWLASCSVDNTIIIWNAEKFPEMVSVLNGHTGLVKGVTWDPVSEI